MKGCPQKGKWLMDLFVHLIGPVSAPAEAAAEVSVKTLDGFRRSKMVSFMLGCLGISYKSVHHRGHFFICIYYRLKRVIGLC